jgi:hypothetical protein
MTSTAIFWLAAINVLLMGLTCAIIADSRGRSAPAWFIGGVFISVYALILVLALPRFERELPEAHRRRIAGDPDPGPAESPRLDPLAEKLIIGLTIAALLGVLIFWLLGR